MAVMLPADCARRLVSELQGALDVCAERQRQLEQSLRVSRRLLQAWEPAGTTAVEPPPGSETKKEDPSPACTSNPQDLKEMELLTQALEKAIRVRKGISKSGERGRTPSLKSGSIAISSGTTASALPQSSSRAAHYSSRTRPMKGIHQTTVPTKGHAEHRLPLVRNRSHVGLGAQATRLELNHGKKMTLSPAHHTAETFTLKEKGWPTAAGGWDGTRFDMLEADLPSPPATLLFTQPRGSSLWTQLNSTQTNDSTDATSAAKTQFLQKMQISSSTSSSKFSAVEIEMETQRLQKACALLRRRMQEELSAAPVDWMQEYQCLLILEGLQTMAQQYLHKVQELCTALTEQLPGSNLMGRPLQASLPSGGHVCTSWGPQLLLYSSTQQLKTLGTLRLRVAMLEQQIHLEKVLMAELLPIVSTQEPQGQPWLALCRAAHSLLCEGGERFLTVLREDPAD
ncbi:tubulin epsilon and delta complex protein 2 isoform X2 [Cavia porcellus]|uniref:tubulin epsilon and delta complex protein 2 isoform X2 n=1 Tax=Cavia porcellus TaxID=10141 RepID=UPI002FDFA873